ncbi:MAG: SDR family NAD(P)-dependent oxidoreductase [Anaerolineales bacterium]|jgi:nucleoside-diphosphate-sugar epimerase
MGRYLVTGAAGFIGASVVRAFLDQGDEVVGVDNLNPAYDVRMKEHRLHRLEGQAGFQFQRMDICDRAGLEKLVAPVGFDAVVNLAARAGVRSSLEDPWAYLDTNVTGTLNLLKACQEKGIPKFVLASTSSVYGANAPLPTPEEADSSRPLQVYAASKKAAEALCHVYHHMFGIDVTVLRYFTVYGPAGRPDMVMFRFVQWIQEGRPVRVNGDGEQYRGFTYVEDIARGTLLAVKPVGYEVINLGGHERVRINALIQMLEGRIGKKARVVHQQPHPADMQGSWASVEKAKTLLGWAPRTAFAEGVSHTVDWYLDERSWASQIVTA